MAAGFSVGYPKSVKEISVNATTKQIDHCALLCFVALEVTPYENGEKE